GPMCLCDLKGTVTASLHAATRTWIAGGRWQRLELHSSRTGSRLDVRVGPACRAGPGLTAAETLASPLGVRGPGPARQAGPTQTTQHYRRTATVPRPPSTRSRWPVLIRC